MEPMNTDALTPESYAARIGALGKNHQAALSAMPARERYVVLSELHDFANANELLWPWWGAVWGRGLGRKPVDQNRPKPKSDPFIPDTSKMTKEEYLHYVFSDEFGDEACVPMHPRAVEWCKAQAAAANQAEAIALGIDTTGMTAEQLAEIILNEAFRRQRLARRKPKVRHP